MKCATKKNNERDGELIVVSRDLTRFLSARPYWKNLQQALDHWDQAKPELLELYETLNQSDNIGEPLPSYDQLASPLPRAYEWIDGSAFINHIVLVRKARNAEPPETLKTEPLVYQGGSGVLLGPHDPIPLANPDWGCDFESEVCIILGDTPQGTLAQDAEPFVRLVLLCNDVSLRNLIPNELKKGFGFFNSKPATAFSPIAVTPDELGPAWKDGRVHLPLVTHLNGEKFGEPNAGEMHFSFFQLIEHICKTRSFTAGTILGSGTVSNEDLSRGSSCLAEKRMIEKINTGTITTPFLQYGDTVEIEMFDEQGRSLCGNIKQKVIPFKKD